MISVKDIDLDMLRVSLIKNNTENLEKNVLSKLTDGDIKYLADETGTSTDYVMDVIRDITGK